MDYIIKKMMFWSNLRRNLWHKVKESDRVRRKEKSIRCLLGLENGRRWKVFTRKLSLFRFPFPHSPSFRVDWLASTSDHLWSYPKRVALHLPLLWTPCRQHKLDCSNEQTKITLLSKASRHKSIHFMKTWHRFLLV